MTQEPLNIYEVKLNLTSNRGYEKEFFMYRGYRLNEPQPISQHVQIQTAELFNNVAAVEVSTVSVRGISDFSTRLEGMDKIMVLCPSVFCMRVELCPEPDLVVVDQEEGNWELMLNANSTMQ